MTILIYNCAQRVENWKGSRTHVRSWPERRQIIVMKAKNAKKWRRISSLSLFYGCRSVPLYCVADTSPIFYTELVEHARVSRECVGNIQSTGKKKKRKKMKEREKKVVFNVVLYYFYELRFRVPLFFFFGNDVNISRAYCPPASK